LKMQTKTYCGPGQRGFLAAELTTRTGIRALLLLLIPNTEKDTVDLPRAAKLAGNMGPEGVWVKQLFHTEGHSDLFRCNVVSALL
jgi:hypothetical protein